MYDSLSSKYDGNRVSYVKPSNQSIHDSLSSKTDGNRVSYEESSDPITRQSLSGPDTLPSDSGVESGATSDYAFSGSISEQVLHNYCISNNVVKHVKYQEALCENPYSDFT